MILSFYLQSCSTKKTFFEDFYAKETPTVYVENNLWENIWIRTPTKILGEVKAKETACFLINEKGRTTLSFDYAGRTYTTPPFNPQYHFKGWKLSIGQNILDDIMMIEPFFRCSYENLKFDNT
ncbi:MAG: hypothetical protein KatS3mg001_006 [Candidatus Pacearchaeota archaeon]|nr:MAG: hypothetical protein KatS3mg001_006 [Candidatus Pacearchaeota archaeon]